MISQFGVKREIGQVFEGGFWTEGENGWGHGYLHAELRTSLQDHVAHRGPEKIMVSLS
jgi:hypothetical protein